MKPKEKTAESGAASVRTGKILSSTGTWLIRCMSCCAVERFHLREGEPAPPCRRCLNPAWVRFLHSPAPVELPAKAAAPAEVPKEGCGTFIGTLEIVPESGTWLIQCTLGCPDEKKIQHKGTWADPCSRCHSPARLSFLPEPAPATAAEAKKGVTDDVDKKKSEAPSVTDDKPTLFDRLKPKKYSEQKAGAGKKR
jgi:hypothetical protein